MIQLTPLSRPLAIPSFATLIVSRDFLSAKTCMPIWPGERFQLVYCCGPVQVCSDQHGGLSCLLQMASEFGSQGRLTRAVQSGDQDDAGLPCGVLEPVTAARKDVGQFFLSYLDDLLAGGELGEQVSQPARAP